MLKYSLFISAQTKIERNLREVVNLYNISYKFIMLRKGFVCLSICPFLSLFLYVYPLRLSFFLWEYSLDVILGSKIFSKFAHFLFLLLFLLVAIFM